jgi:hypothetical protein
MACISQSRKSVPHNTKNSPTSPTTNNHIMPTHPPPQSLNSPIKIFTSHTQSTNFKSKHNITGGFPIARKARPESLAPTCVNPRVARHFSPHKILEYVNYTPKNTVPPGSPRNPGASLHEPARRTLTPRSGGGKLGSQKSALAISSRLVKRGSKRKTRKLPIFI